jgi:predicted phosphodiesterase
MSLDDIIRGEEMKRNVEKLQEEISTYKNSEAYKIIKELEKKNLSVKEIRSVIKAAEQGNPNYSKTYTIGKERTRFGIIGDTHIGNMNYDSNLMKFAVKQFNKEKVDFVIHTGDILDGVYYTHRPTQIYESDVLGGDAQIKKAVKELGQIKQPLYFITGNHEYNTFMRSAGIEVGFHLEKNLKENGNEAYFIGNAEGDIKLKGGAVIKALHPDGGTAYAISYKSQKIVESFEGGKKPNVLLIGHFHKAEYIFYRNVHVLQSGCFEGQTKFMKGKGIPAHKGFWIVDVYSKGEQVDKIVPSFYPAYD